MTSEWVELLEEVLLLQEERLRSGQQLWFRGQSHAWPLLSTLHRRVLSYVEMSGMPVTDPERAGLLHDEYNSLYQDFRSKAYSLLSPQERTSWGLVFTMQHHRIPTRLLDWTTSFACALFFSYQNWDPSQEAVVFALFPEELNMLSSGGSVNGLIAVPDEGQQGKVNLDSYLPDYLEKPVVIQGEHGSYSEGPGAGPTYAVIPPLSNQRMVAQQSVFTVSGNSFLPLEQQLKGKGVRKFVLSPKVYKDVDRFLELQGAGPFTYFPDLEGIAEDVKAKHQRTKRLVEEILAEQQEQDSGTTD